MQAWPVRSACSSVHSVDVAGCTFETWASFSVGGNDPYDAARRKRVLREGNRPTTTKLKAKKGDHMRHGGSGEANSGDASCSFHHPGSGASTGPSLVGERPSGGRQHLPPSCYPPAGPRKKIVPPAPPLPVEKRRFQLFAAADDVVSDLGGVDPGPGAKLLGVKLEQRQEEAVCPPEPPALSSNSFPGSERERSQMYVPLYCSGVEHDRSVRQQEALANLWLLLWQVHRARSLRGLRMALQPQTCS